MALIKFNNKNITVFGSVHNPYFLGIEIGAVLGYARPIQAIYDHVWEINKISFSKFMEIPQNDSNENQIPQEDYEIIPDKTIMLNEPVLYQLIFSSKLETALLFQQCIIDGLSAFRKQLMEKHIQCFN